MPNLFSPLTLRGVTLPNRIAVSPMCQYTSEDGFANDWHLVHLGSRAVGGAGLIVSEAAAVRPEGRITPGDLGIYKEDHVVFLKRITDFIHDHGSVAAIQLAHAGRKASCLPPWEGRRQLGLSEGGWQTLAPSEIAYQESDRPPSALSKEEIKDLIEDFAKAAERAVRAGFKVIELHAAHGYLLHEFYSPLSNKREDEYGGSLENRCRIVLEIVRAIRKSIPEDCPLFVRISATDWLEGGWNLEDSIVLSRWLAQEGVDLIDCSTGGNARAKVPVGPDYQVPFAEEIKKAVQIPTGAVGLITEPAQADAIIREGKADIILMGREMLRDPYFALHAATALGHDAKYPIQYERAKP